MTTFKVGEIVVGHSFVDFPQHNGEDLLIIEGPAHFHAAHQITKIVEDGIGYKVKDTRGEVFVTYPMNLRRKSPPASTADEREYAELMDRLMNRKEQTA